MEALTDWYKLWNQLCEIQNKAFGRKKEYAEDDFWKHKARHFDKMVDERWEKPDSSRDFLIQKLKDNPGATLLDIGAGTGKWSLLVSPYAAKVTALDPSLAMQEILKEKIQKQGINNIDIVTGIWPEDDVASHDFVLASHSMYGVADFKAFVDKMSATATKACIMLLRAPFADSVMAIASRHVLGQPYDSPNFQVAYNALLGMDIYPDVIMEEAGTWPAWTHDSFEEALDDLKNRLGICDTSQYDDFLSDLLEKHLILKDCKFVWPSGNRSALVYWEV
ncbi:class I SAM-dependent methyltransferase [Desulfobacula phenolica]|uniref:Methyltransferase domain-containing protein n=1 Tax=Desulfobacula phenolica TaxID=90732 RepID=A0A1H2FIL2_9BACT|nr:methyltransferase domain-containing protein [Desulfobacula phenolica]SDU07162.1 Methyltransferase domain-containing protein [Desulfobacula phenolica]